MKLYHATKAENKENILEVGLSAVESDKLSNDERLEGEFVFGFDNIDDARDFITCDCSESEYVIFAFDVSESDLIVDTEYDGEAFAVAMDVENVELIEEV